MYSRNLFVLDFARRFFVSCAQIFEAYAVRTLIKFGCDWRKIGRKGKCMKDSESTCYIFIYRKDLIFMENMLRVGVVTSTHGVRGEVKVFPTTDDAKRFKKLKTVILDTGKGQTALEIEQVKFFKNMVILKFKGYDNINDVETWRQKDLLITREQAVALKPDEYFITDLIGLQVNDDEGNEVGTIKDVLETGANDVYVVALPNGKELLLPAIKDCILNVDMENGEMTVHILDGLMDL
jgi:16S rRNA processing protein RimM